MKETIRDITKELARVKPVKKGLMVKHPFTSTAIINGRDITEDAEAFERFIKDIEKKIDACRTMNELIELIEPAYRDRWLGLCRGEMSNREFSKFAGTIRTTDPELLKTANKKYVMTANEQKVVEALPKTLTLYKTGKVWCRDKKKAREYARTDGRHTMLKAKAFKEDVLCYYERDDCYVIDSDRIEEVEI